MLTFHTYFLPKDNRSEAWLTEILEQTADKRTSSYKTQRPAIMSVLSSLVAYQGAEGFEVIKRHLTPDERKAWELLRVCLMGYLLERVSGRNTYKIKRDVIPDFVSVVTTKERNLSFGIEGQGVLFTNTTQLIPELASRICGVYAAVIELQDPEIAFQKLIDGTEFPRRWTAGTDLGKIKVTSEAVELVKRLYEYLNASFTRSGYLYAFKYSEGRITLVCAADITNKLLDTFAVHTLRFFQQHRIPQIILPMHISGPSRKAIIEGVPLTQERNHASQRNAA